MFEIVFIAHMHLEKTYPTFRGKKQVCKKSFTHGHFPYGMGLFLSIYLM
jgi:hypothetical protein